MTTFTAQPPRARSGVCLSAAHLAGLNWTENRGALLITQPRLLAAVGAAPIGLRWVFGRDGSLTAFDAVGQWLNGCSVPMRAAEAMLTTLEVKGRVACLLAPTLASQVRVALQHSRSDQAVLALCPNVAALCALLHCGDFSVEICARRLWFAWGADWTAGMAQLFAEQPGLATPAQFIRLPTTPPEDVEQLVTSAQRVFVEVNAARITAVASRRDAWRPLRNTPPRLCVIAPSRYKLWADAGAVLAGTLAETSAPGQATVACFNPDDPAQSSALALLEAAVGCDAVVAADTARADLPGVLPPDMPWLTWVTTPATIPAFAAAGPRDALLLADKAWQTPALQAGWPEHRMTIAGWPPLASTPADASRAPALAIIADTRPVVAPDKLDEFSSHQLLWNAIAAELSTDPFALGDDPLAYLEQSMRRHGVGAEGFDRGLFLTSLIVPTYEQSLARLLVSERVPLRLHGHGWEHLAEFRPYAAGPITSRAHLCRVHLTAAAIVQTSPADYAHPRDALGRPILRRHGMTRAAYLRAAHAALAGRLPPAPAIEPITLRQVLSQLAY